MLEKLWSYKQIEDLRRDHVIAKATISDHERRSLFPIAVIDDKPFHYEQNLQANNFQVKYLGDINTIDDVKDYNIVLCDLQGVGTRMNARGQGAYIIDEIKRHFPEKFVVAYTGGSLDDSITVLAQEHSDFFLKKDADIDDWRDTLDDIIGQLSDPISVWRRQRDALVEADVPTLDILKLEDAYVSSVKQGSDKAYRSMAAKRELSSDLRSIANSLIASGIFRAFIG